MLLTREKFEAERRQDVSVDVLPRNRRLKRTARTGIHLSDISLTRSWEPGVINVNHRSGRVAPASELRNPTSLESSSIVVLHCDSPDSAPANVCSSRWKGRGHHWQGTPRRGYRSRFLISEKPQG